MTVRGLEGAAEIHTGLERLNTAEQVAERFQIGRSKVYELLKSGELRSVRIGGSRRIPESAVTEFLRGLETEAS